MKAIFILLGVVAAVNGAILVTRNVCEDESTGVAICCDGWTGSVDDGCPTPVCEESCVHNGGACFSPNRCIDCPADRFGVNCEKSQCEQEKFDHGQLGWVESRQMFKPSCLPDGSYTILQCHQVTHICHCAHRWTGEPYVDTYSHGVPDCTKYHINERPLFSPKEVLLMESSEESFEIIPEPSVSTTPPCTKKHEEWSASSPFLSFFNPEPQCAEDGYYVSHRCDQYLGYCICMDRNTGLDIEYTKIHSTDIDCTDISTPEHEPEPIAPHEPLPEEGCVKDGKYYEQDKSFYRDCNVCVCHGLDIIQCTQRDCTTDACHLGEINKVVEHVFNGLCHQCICNHGIYDCEMVDCNQLDNPGEMEEVPFCNDKPPQTHYYDECNSCYCREDGMSLCTTMGCNSQPGSCYVDSRNYPNGQQFTKGCDTFRCVDGELETVGTCADTMVDMVLTEAKPETACLYDGEKFFNGESMLLGYKMCKCEKFNWNCQLMMMM